MKRRKKKMGDAPKPVYVPRTPSARTPGQQTFLDATAKFHTVICTGPAGCGKTHLSIGTAVDCFRKGSVSSIVLTRPLIGVDEDSGALPGTAEEKIQPYLRPLFDELRYYASFAEIGAWQTGPGRPLEIAPLQFMRGRTFKNAFVVLDEAQNATFRQLFMLLTRIGEGGRLVIVGDPAQSDLAKGERGALAFCAERLVRMEEDGVGVVELVDSDIVRRRHIGKLIQRLRDFKGE